MAWSADMRSLLVVRRNGGVERLGLEAHAKKLPLENVSARAPRPGGCISQAALRAQPDREAPLGHASAQHPAVMAPLLDLALEPKCAERAALWMRAAAGGGALLTGGNAGTSLRQPTGRTRTTMRWQAIEE
jgi:hypothetical protein